MSKAELEQRTKEFSLNLTRFLQSLPKNYLGEAMGRQLLKSGASIGANYREANRARSKADFIHKLAIADKDGLGDCLLAGVDDRGSDRRPQGYCQAFTGGQGDFGDIHRSRADFERTPMIPKFEIQNSKWVAPLNGCS